MPNEINKRSGDGKQQEYYFTFPGLFFSWCMSISITLNFIFLNLENKMWFICKYALLLQKSSRKFLVHSFLQTFIYWSWDCCTWTLPSMNVTLLWQSFYSMSIIAMFSLSSSYAAVPAPVLPNRLLSMCPETLGMYGTSFTCFILPIDQWTCGACKITANGCIGHVFHVLIHYWAIGSNRFSYKGIFDKDVPICFCVNWLWLCSFAFAFCFKM